MSKIIIIITTMNKNQQTMGQIIALEQLTSHMTLNAGQQQQRLESPTITPPGMR